MRCIQAGRYGGFCGICITGLMEQEVNGKRFLPPTYLFGAIAAMVLLDFAAPGRGLIEFPWNLAGVAALVVGIVFNLVADAQFKREQTTVKPFEQSGVLVTGGLFRISRHPMYLGMVLILAGIAVLLGSLTPYIVLAGFAAVMDVVFIRAEERMLAARFGDAWQRYRPSFGGQAPGGEAVGIRAGGARR